MAKNQREGIATNGAKIRELREKASLSQKALLKGSSVAPRTLQRAEAGERISADQLQMIAGLLKVDPNELRSDQGFGAMPSNSYRLVSVKTVGSRKLLRELRDGAVGVIYDFEVDVDSSKANEIAEFVERCQELEFLFEDGFSAPDLSPTDEIRHIGRLHDGCAKLASLGVCVYFGEHFRWKYELDKGAEISSKITGQEAIIPFNISSEQYLHILFSAQETDHIVRVIREYHTLAHVTERAAIANYRLGIKPEWLDRRPIFGFSRGFIEAYTVLYNREQAQRARPISPPRLIAKRQED